MTQPLVTFCTRSRSTALIKSELKTFGLNPNDWEAIEENVGPTTRWILVHRDDEEVRLAVQIDATNLHRGHMAIQDVEWLITGA